MPKIDGGYILLARKILESEVMNKPPLYFKLWGWMLLQAKFRDTKNLKRGQFKTSIQEMQEAMSYKIGYRKVTPTRKEIRGVYESLTKGHMVGHTKVTGGMIITILNYEEYQNIKNYEGHDEGHDEGNSGGTSYNKERKRKNEYIESGKSGLDFFMPSLNGIDQDEFEKTVNGLISTRKTNQITVGVLEAELEYWHKYPDHVVNKSLKIYNTSEYWKQDKNEKYLRGIIRGEFKRHEKSASQTLLKKAH